jgi:hypothetical protein
MKPIVRLLALVVLTTLCLSSCLKKPSRKTIEENLKTAMAQFLNHPPGVDSPTVQFKVLDVDFYEEKKYYVCEFNVNMKQKTPEKLIDTTGKMTATVSLDFQKVHRRF